MDDDVELSTTLKQWLQAEHHQVELVHDGATAWEHLQMKNYNLIILDWDLPGFTGVELCRKYRDIKGATPVVMLTGKTEVRQRVEALDVGADDYIMKPFAMPELLSRVRALLRRQPAYVGEILRAGKVQLDTVRRQVMVDGAELRLKPIEYSVLEYFMRNPNRAISSEMLLQDVWSSESEASVDSVYVCINRLRKKLETRTS